MLNNCQRRLLPTLAVLFAPAVMAQGIIYVQMPPSPSLGLVQDPNTGQWVDPFASYDAQGLRLWGTAQSPATYNLVLNGQVAYTFTSQDSGFTINATGNNQIIGGYLDNLGAQGAYPLSGGAFIGPNLGSSTYTWFGGESTIAAATASETIGSPILFTGPFAGVASAYIGLEFYFDGDAYYGWVRVGAPVSINGGWIYDYAYETTPNTPIAAGAVPEPNTLALVAVGALLLGFRRGHNSH